MIPKQQDKDTEYRFFEKSWDKVVFWGSIAGILLVLALYMFRVYLTNQPGEQRLRELHNKVEYLEKENKKLHKENMKLKKKLDEKI
ncbi:MAG: hypothetical protein MI922_20340 [Bacteroidales bacterium]|nr:hypothetical protein [Bacteroidales bacterium]